MEQNIIYLDFSGCYEGMQGEHLDCSDIPGTNCYCDDPAADMLRKRLAAYDASGIHFFDSGNYHYISLFWLEKIEEDFALVLLDHHPDLKPPSFGTIISCGGWVQDALLRLPHLKKVYMVGVEEALLEELKPLPPQVQRGLPTEEAFPLYISLDKDVMTEADARCDWSQGQMSLSEVLQTIGGLSDAFRIIGVDICGEKKDHPSAEDLAINRSTNQKIIEYLT